MEIRSYNAELAYANMLFMNIFRNIVIERQASNGDTKLIQVNCVYGLRSRVLKNLQNPDKRGTMKLPLIVISRSGISRNPERLNNLHNEVKYQETSKRRNYNLYTPVPIDITYDVSIVTKFPNDADKIMSNFLCFFNPDIFVRCRHPKYTELTFNNQIIMQDSITEEHQDELDSTTDDFTTMLFLFVFKTYIFAGPDTVSYKTNVIPKISSYISAMPVLSSVLSTIVSNDISVSLPIEVSVELSTEISTVVDVIYDGFVPQINGIDVGFYGVKITDGFEEYMDYVDTLSAYDPYVDRLIWKIDDASDAEFPDNVKCYRKSDLYGYSVSAANF